ncbi:MAG: hypothetical protein P1V13_23840, partial [Rhizobiaceae bacterium]|nr:hypothetical protein [Rhizobiaceae bacterium]
GVVSDDPRRFVDFFLSVLPGLSPPPPLALRHCATLAFSDNAGELLSLNIGLESVENGPPAVTLKVDRNFCFGIENR